MFTCKRKRNLPYMFRQLNCCKITAVCFWHNNVSSLGLSQNVMEQFNPALRNLVNLGKSYEKSVSGRVRFHRHIPCTSVVLFKLSESKCLCSLAAMTLAGKAYFHAVSKIGENAIVSPMSRELGKFMHVYFQVDCSEGNVVYFRLP